MAKDSNSKEVEKYKVHKENDKLILKDGNGVVKHVLSRTENTEQTESIKIPRIGDTVREKGSGKVYEVMKITGESPRYRLNEPNTRFGAKATLQEIEDDYELIKRGDDG